MKRRVILITIYGICLAIGAASCTTGHAEPPAHHGLARTSPIYGYDPYKLHYGPIYAQRELDYLTHQPGVRGLDYGYGIGYFFGFGPPKQYRLLPPTEQTKAIQGRR